MTETWELVALDIDTAADVATAINDDALAMSALLVALGTFLD
jgi:hypothetical protein